MGMVMGMTDSTTPALQPRHEDWLEVDGDHRIHFAQWGRPAAIPVAYLHGGPGSGCAPDAHLLFDLVHFAPVLHDQRGAGRSEPAGALEANTTEDLLQDMERLRVHLGIERWLLFGGSWGAALALLYAQRFPERVLGMVLRGVFLARPSDVRWFFGPNGVARIFPREYAAFTEGVSVKQRENPQAAYAERLQDADPEVRREAAQQWYRWEDTVVSHGLPQNARTGAQAPQNMNADSLVQRARIAAHYACHDFFLGGAGVLHAPERLHGIPGQVVHGAQDLVCPMENARTLHRHWPEARLRVVEGAGHAASHPEIRKQLLSALEELARTPGS